MTDEGKCPLWAHPCEYVSMVEAQAAEIERLTKASDGDVGLMHWQAEKIETLTAEIDRLRAVVDSLIDRIAGMEALTPTATIILDPAILAVKAEQ